MKRVLAWIGIGLLLAMYLTNLVLALIGSDATRGMFMACVICTIMIPIILYCFLMLSKKFSSRREMKKDFEELDRLMSEDGDAANADMPGEDTGSPDEPFSEGKQ